MGAQSAVLGYEFGLSYELGKRTIKAMPNDLFNKLVAGSSEEIHVVFDGIEYTMKYSEYLDFLVKQHHNLKITEFRNLLPNYQSLQNDIIEASVQIEKAKATRTPSAFREIFEAFTGGFSEQQKEDLGNFFGTFTDSFSRLLGWFGLNSTSTEPTQTYATLQTVTSFNYGYLDVCNNTAINTGTPEKDAFGHRDALLAIQSAANEFGTCQEQSQFSRLQAYSEAFTNFYGFHYSEIGTA